MAAKDIFHEKVKSALIKDGWQVTHDPLELSYGKVELQIDLGAENLIAAEKEAERIAVEIKSFIEPSKVYAFHLALGQYINYKRALRANDADRKLFMAITEDILQSFFLKQEMTQDAILEDDLQLIVFDPEKEEIVQWIS